MFKTAKATAVRGTHLVAIYHEVTTLMQYLALPASAASIASLPPANPFYGLSPRKWHACLARVSTANLPPPYIRHWIDLFPQIQRRMETANKHAA